MKQNESENGVPRCKNVIRGRFSGRSRRRSVKAIACMGLMIAAIVAGYHTAPEDTRLPILLADGEVIMQPCYVAVDGEPVALVKNKKTAETVMEQVENQYKNDETTQVEIEEETTIENLDLENGDEKPEILTAEEAAAQIVKQEKLTVKTKEVIEEEQTVVYDTVEKESSRLSLGETQVQQQGKNGIEILTKEVTKENGKVVEEEVVEHEIIKECVDEIILYGTAGMVDPLDHLRITSDYGSRWGRQHEGVDLGMEQGAPIYAAKAGAVTFAGYCGGYGNLVKVDHGDGLETYYAHCSRIDVAVGQTVAAGQAIAAVGSTGNSTGPHLHFEVRLNGAAQDPMQWLDSNE